MQKRVPLLACCLLSLISTHSMEKGQLNRTLIRAVQRRNLPEAEKLISSGAMNLSALDNQGNSVLGHLIYPSVDSLQDLSAFATNFAKTVHEHEKSTIIDKALAMQHDKTIISLLMRYGLNQDISTLNKSTGIHSCLWAMSTIDTDISFLNISEDERSFYKLFLKKRYNNIISLLLEQKANVNAQERSGHTACHLALCFELDANVVLRLLNAGADPMLETEYRWNSLHLAMNFKPHPTIVSKIIMCGADPSTKNPYGETTFHVIAHHCLTELCQELLPTKKERDMIQTVLMIYKINTITNNLSKLPKPLFSELLHITFGIQFFLLKKYGKKAIQKWLLLKNNKNKTALDSIHAESLKDEKKADLEKLKQLLNPATYN